MHDDRAVFLTAPDRVMAVTTVWENPSEKDLGSVKRQVFKTTDLTIAKDDLVVAEIEARHGMAVFKVTEVKIRVDLRSDQPLPWIVSRIDQVAHIVNKQNETKLTDALRRGEEKRLRDQLAKDMLEGIEGEIEAIEFGGSKSLEK